MTKQSRTTYIDTQKLRELVDNSELSKKEIIRETGITDKTFQRALSLSKKHTINKDAVSKLAEFFKLNYEDLIDKEKEKNLSDIDRTVLDRIWDARQLLNLKGHKYIKKNYHINLNKDISGSIKKIVEFTFSKDLQIAQNNRSSNQNIKANFENELKYIDLLADSNESINKLELNNVGIYIGYWNSNIIIPDYNFDDYEQKFPYWRPKKEKLAMLLFSYINNYNYTPPKKTSQKIVYPNKGFSADELFETYIKLLDKTKCDQKDYTLNHYFPQKMGISIDEWYENYFQEPSYKFLPRADYDDFLDNYLNESFLRQERNEFFNLDKQYTGKIVDVEVEDDEQNKKEDDM